MPYREHLAICTSLWSRFIKWCPTLKQSGSRQQGVQMMVETKWWLGQRQLSAQEKHLKQQPFSHLDPQARAGCGYGSQLRSTAPLSAPCYLTPHLCEPTNCITCRRKARPSPRGGLVGTAQLRDARHYNMRPCLPLQGKMYLNAAIPITHTC